MAVLQNPSETAVAAALSFLLFAGSYVIYQRYFSPLAAVPGPFFASISSLWLAHAYWRQDWHRYSIRLHEKYGPVVRTAPDTVDVGDVGAIRVIYGAGSKFWKGRWYSQLGGGREDDHLLRVTDQLLHKQKRRLIDPIYTLKSVREYEHLLHDPITFFVKQMRAKRGQEVDIDEWTTVFAIDAFTAVTYGKAYGLLERGRAPEMTPFVDINWNPYTWAVMMHCGALARLYQNASVTLKVILSGGKPPVPILGWVTEQIEKGIKADQQQEAAEAITLLQKTLRQHHEHPDKFSLDSVKCHMFEIVFAGFETCGTTIPKIMYFVSNTAGCQERLREELLEKAKAKESGGLEGLLTYDELLQLPYLTACINEGFRVYPMIGISLSRKVPNGGVKVSGFDLPAGTEIGITPWVTSYNKEIMPEPDRFRPERWIEATPEQHARMQGTDLFFGAGPASCPGKTLANALIFKTLAVIFSNFHVTVITPRSAIEEVNIFPVKWRKYMMKLKPLEK